MRWILDDRPFQTLARVMQPSDLGKWPAGDVLVADATANAAHLDQSARRGALLKATASHSRDLVISVFAVTVGSPAGTILYQHLRSASGGTANLAEHESIAWALTTGKDAVLVTGDKLAAFLALSELGRDRVCHPFEYWHYLHSERLVSSEKYGELNAMTTKADTSIPGVPWRFALK